MSTCEDIDGYHDFYSGPLSGPIFTLTLIYMAAFVVVDILVGDTPDGALKPMCWIHGHDWIDEWEYGLTPKCSLCGQERE